MKEVKFMKAACLMTLTLQNAVLALSMRYGRTQPGDMFISSTAVIVTEIVKLLLSLAIVYYYEAFSVVHFIKHVYGTVVKQRMDTLKVCIPSMAYVIQNNLLYISASHLDAATYQVTYQMKILTTAIFAVLILNRSLAARQWSALSFLVVGVVLVQLSDAKDNSSSGNSEQNRTIGMIAALSACFISGFAGIFFEKILKGSDTSVWMRNVQLSILSIPAGFIHCFAYDWKNVTHNGFFFGYNYFVVYLILLQAVGGLLVALVVKYADNILKGFATSLAIILSCLFSMYLFDFKLNTQFVSGALLVIISIFLYTGLPSSPTTQKGGIIIEKA